eukprot:6479752-Amphidinium_carterae.1
MQLTGYAYHGRGLNERHHEACEDTTTKRCPVCNSQASLREVSHRLLWQTIRKPVLEANST